MTTGTKKGTVLSLPYPLTNLIFAGIILGIMVYSGVFSSDKNNHPIPSFYELANDKPSPSRGLSRSFSEIMRGRFDGAREYNEHGLRIFLFFFLQFFMRLAATWAFFKFVNQRRYLVMADITVTLALFTWSFWYFLAFWKFY